MPLAEFLNSTHRSIAWFKQVHEAGDLEMRPPFQRNLVWTGVQKTFLIDTILRGYPIPELYMQAETDAKGRERHIVVDGQQRIQACLEFLTDDVVLDAANNPAYADMVFSELTENDKKAIFSYTFVVRTVPIIPEVTLREVFQRLNRNNLVLNEQELRHATYWGAFIKLIEELSDLEYWGDFGVFTANDLRRMLDIEYVSELVIGMMHGLQNKKTTLDKWYKTYEQKFDEAPDVRSRVLSTLGEIKQLLPNLRGTRWRKKSDFYSLFLSLAKHASQFPLTATNRQRVGKVLELLAAQAEVYIAAKKLQDSKALAGLPKYVGKYVLAVEKAASDLANRKARDEVIEALLSKFI